jgi:hypothetical protein
MTAGAREHAHPIREMNEMRGLSLAYRRTAWPLECIGFTLTTVDQDAGRLCRYVAFAHALDPQPGVAEVPRTNRENDL